MPMLARYLPEMGVGVESQSLSEGAVPDGVRLKIVTPEAGGDSFGIVFTDEGAAAEFLGRADCYVMKKNVLWALQAALRQKLAGLVINPGTNTQYTVSQGHMKLLLREYAVVQLTRLGGGWVSTLGGSTLAVQMPQGDYSVPVYLSREDAEAATAKLEGHVELVPWRRIRERCRQVQAAEAFLQFGFPEQVGLTMAHLAVLCGEPDQNPLAVLEREVAQSGGVANATAIGRTLANLDEIWVLQDQAGDLITLDGVVDLFTAPARVDVFLAEVRTKAPQLGPLKPRLVKVRPLFAALAGQRLTMAINRGSEASWCDLAGTLSDVLKQLA